MIKKIYLLSSLKDITFGTYETIRSTFPQPIKTDLDKYKEMVKKDLKHLFVTTVYPMDHVRAVYDTFYARLERRSKGNHTAYEIHEKAVKMTEKKLHFDTANNR